MSIFHKYNALSIAPFFINKGVTPLQLHKLLYYTQVWYFVKHRHTLFNNEIQAWIYGPVIKDVWNYFRYMRRSDIIPKRILNSIYSAHLPSHVQNHLNEVWNAYGHLSGADLVDLTHNELPWINSRLGCLTNEPSDNVIEINSDTTSDFKLTYFGTIPRANSLNSFGHYQSYH